jgi:UDP-GlcNAc:undecaprenyl-phosphate/decaprenyl-phosphate GlcNAc-1-phosphate transferase
MLGLPDWAIFIGVFVIAFAVSWFLTPFAAWLSHKLGIVDVAGGRRRHQGAIPRLGGVAIFGGFIVATLLTLPYPRSGADTLRLTGLLLGAVAIFVGGLLDDKYRFSPLPQLLFTLLAAGIAIRYQVFIQIVNNPFTNQPLTFSMPLTIALTLFWMAGMTVTVNWLDGLDGLATGVSAIAVLVFFVHMLRTGQQSVALLPLALLGAILGFLPRNFHPARIFLGGGAYFLGFSVGALSIIGGARAATALLVMGVPILDVAWQILRRLRQGRSPGAGDRGHLHFRLVDLGVPQQRIVLLYYGFSALFGLLALFIPSRLFKLLALVVLGLVVIIILAILTRIGERRGAKVTDASDVKRVT